MSSIATWRKKLASIQEADSLIEYVTQQSRVALYTHSDYVLSNAEEKRLQTLLQRYRHGEPIAYLIGTAGFWTMDLIVTKDTLIPRPETECLIQWVINHIHSTSAQVADLGTGTGAIAIALALENPRWQIDATDISEAALRIAKQNAKKYSVNHIRFYTGHWCAALPKKNKYDMIIANPPYIAENDPHLFQLTAEPKQSLVAGTDGLSAIRDIISQAKNHLEDSGVLILEHGFHQADSVMALLQAAQFQNIASHQDLSGQHRFVTATQ